MWRSESGYTILTDRNPPSFVSYHRTVHSSAGKDTTFVAGGDVVSVSRLVAFKPREKWGGTAKLQGEALGFLVGAGLIALLWVIL